MAMEGFLNFIQDPRGTMQRCNRSDYTPCGLASSDLIKSQRVSTDRPIAFQPQGNFQDLEEPEALAIRHTPRDVRTMSRREFAADSQPDLEHSNPRMQKSQLVLELLEGGSEIEIDQDVYGAALYVICFDLFELLTGVDHDGMGNHINMYRFCFIMFLLICNYILQLGMLYWIYYYVATPSVHNVQVLYRDFHNTVYIEGKLSAVAWSHYPRKEELCSIAFSNFFFMFAILSLWWVTMINEVRKNERLYRKIHEVHLTDDPAAMIVNHDDTNVVVHLTRSVRTGLDVALIIPKMIIVAFLTVVGTVWLAATDSFSDLLLNAIALEFVVNIDDILFSAIVPESMKEEIQQTKLVRPAPFTSGDPTENAVERLKQKLRGYQRSTFFLFGTIFAVYLYLTLGQYVPIIGVFPGYAHDIDCPRWQATRTETLCFMGENCFPTEGGLDFGNQFLPPSSPSSGRR